MNTLFFAAGGVIRCCTEVMPISVADAHKADCRMQAM